MVQLLESGTGQLCVLQTLSPKTRCGQNGFGTSQESNNTHVLQSTNYSPHKEMRSFALGDKNFVHPRGGWLMHNILMMQKASFQIVFSLKMGVWSGHIVEHYWTLLSCSEYY